MAYLEITAKTFAERIIPKKHFVSHSIFEAVVFHLP